ncbi:signal peptidase I [Metabacillus sp. KIGAM252]|uniref:Signal peptidase I n=1 Tax=Metabacillus flavus TaxID=2823519 RepID=A0ABS5LFW1_9BACI|nr:signal peptidase I [Metabacillus flavus]MBS2969628.1 signal peptidase I [Metabacillus flavus]
MGDKMFNNIRIYALRFTFLLGILFYVLLLGNTNQFLPFHLKNVLSGSMEPVFSTGSMILIKKLEAKEVLQKGEIITFKTKDEILITHRIHEVLNNQTYRTKGDANDGIDRELVKRENIVGSYTGLTIPFAGYLFIYIQSNTSSFLVLLILPGLFFLYLAYKLLFQQAKAKIDY